jgi:hypothetical protein
MGKCDKLNVLAVQFCYTNVVEVVLDISTKLHFAGIKLMRLMLQVLVITESSNKLAF